MLGEIYVDKTQILTSRLKQRSAPLFLKSSCYRLLGLHISRWAAVDCKSSVDPWPPSGRKSSRFSPPSSLELTRS